MPVALNDILALVGRFDTATGFDAPRERFRRFLFDRVTDPTLARALIEPLQHSLGEQHRRALQDLVVVLGRLLGFETTFAAYPRAAMSNCDGHWRSRGRLEVDVVVRTDPTLGRDVQDLAHSSGSPRHVDHNVVHLTLSVVTPLYAGRARLEDPAAEKLASEGQVSSIASILWLADMLHAGRMKHVEVVRLLTSGVNLDLIVDLMAHFADDREPRGERAPAFETVTASAAPPSESYWVTTIEPDENARPEQLVQSVIAGRRILAVREASAEDVRVRTGDWICFSLRRKGIVGHAQVEGVVDGRGLIRGSDRFRLVLRLKNVEIYDAPRVFTTSEPVEEIGPRLGSLTREQFAVLTSHGDADRLRQTG